MAFIDKSVSFSIVFLINCMLSVRSENCKSFIDFIITNKLYILNTSEKVAFFPTDLKFVTTSYGGVACSTGNCTTSNEVLYKGSPIVSLSDTDLEISDDDLSVAIYNSIANNTQFKGIISVFPNRFVIKSQNEKNTILIYSTVFGLDINILNPGCDRTKFQYRSKIAKIKGVVCKVHFLSGIRYGLNCGDIQLYLNAINEYGDLDHETKCEP